MEQRSNAGQDPYGQPRPSYPPYYQRPPNALSLTNYGVPPPRRRNNRIIAGVIVGVVLLVVAGIIHVNSATGIVKGLYDDLFSFNLTSASARICLNAPNQFRTGLATLESRLSQIKGQATFETSNIAYALTSGGLTSAVVKVTGEITIVQNNGSVTTTPAALGSNRNESDYQVNLSGVEWCVYNDISTPAPPSG